MIVLVALGERVRSETMGLDYEAVMDLGTEKEKGVRRGRKRI